MDTTVVIDTPLEEREIRRLWVLIARDEKGNEGIATFNGLPLVTSRPGGFPDHIINDITEGAKAIGKRLFWRTFEVEEEREVT